MTGIKDLANHLNISIGTISRALNNKPDVNPETRRRVLEAAEKLGYAPNQSGRSLRQGKTNVIGFTFVANAEMAASNDNFVLGVVSGIQHEVAQHDLDLVTFPCPSIDDQFDHLQRIVGRGLVDGIIITGTQPKDRRIPYLLANGIPFVAFGRSGWDDCHHWMDADAEGVARRCVDRLVSMGHRRIALSLPKLQLQRYGIFLESYKTALRSHGLELEPELMIATDTSELGGVDVANQVLAMANRPTAIVLHYELMAIGLYSRLSDAGVVVGEDIAVISLRDHPQCRFLRPSLTRFSLSLAGLGEALARRVLSQMQDFNGIYQDLNFSNLWPLKLMEGESDDFIVDGYSSLPEKPSPVAAAAAKRAAATN